MSDNKTPRNTKKILLRLWKYIFRYKFHAFLALFLSVSSNLLALLGPMLSGKAIDAIGIEAHKVDMNSVFLYCALMIGFYFISSILSYLLARLMIHLGQKIVFHLREDVFNRLVDLPVGYFDQHQTGDIISRISYDIDVINTTLSTDLLQVFTSIFTVIGSFLMMINISPQLILVFVVTVPISILFTHFFTRKVRPLFRRRSSRLGELNGFVEETLSGQKTIVAYNQEENTIQRFDEKNTAANNAYYRAEYYGSMTGPSINFINGLSITLVSVFGALLFLQQKITLGSLSSFVLYSRRFSGPINEAANIISEFQSTMSAAERVFRVMDEPTEIADITNASELSNVQGAVVLEHVEFGYEENKKIIKDLNLDADAGKLVAIVGPTGAGKTTLINLLMRFYDIQSGKISVDSYNIQEVTRKSLRLAYSMVLQDTWLFYGTIFDNIAYGKKDATIEEVMNAAKTAKIHNYITSLPQGYQTVLNEDALNISQGQKQLLTIARAMLLQSSMLILDEATSNIDTQTELQIQEAMLKLMEKKTCFIIAHRLSTIQNADIILVVNQGEIVEQGKHQELLDNKGFYYELYQSQFQ